MTVSPSASRQTVEGVGVCDRDELTRAVLALGTSAAVAVGDLEQVLTALEDLGLAAADRLADAIRTVRGDDCEPAYLRAAYAAGQEAGRAAASWAADGNTSDEHRLRVLAMLDAGDPAADDYLPRWPVLAEDPRDGDTAATLTAHTGGDPTCQEATTAAADAWERGVSDTFYAACEQTLRAGLSEEAQLAAATGDLDRLAEARTLATGTPAGDGG